MYVSAKSETRYLDQINGSSREKAGFLDHLTDLNPTDVILEVGPGGGCALELLCARLNDLEVEARPVVAVLDLSHEVLLRANDILTSAQFPAASVRATAGGVLPFADGAISVMNCTSVLHEIFSYAGGEKGISTFIQESARVLKTGGVLFYRDPDGVRLNEQAASFLKTPAIRLFASAFLRKYFSNSMQQTYSIDGLSLSIDGVRSGLTELNPDVIEKANSVLLRCEAGLMHELKRHFVLFMKDCGFFFTDEVDLQDVKEILGKQKLYVSPREKTSDLVEFFERHGSEIQVDGNIIYIEFSDLCLLYEKLIEYAEGNGCGIKLDEHVKSACEWMAREGVESYYYGDAVDVVSNFFKHSICPDPNAKLGYSCMVPLSYGEGNFTERPHYKEFIAANVLDVEGGYNDGKRSIHFVKRPLELALPSLLDFFKKTGNPRALELVQYANLVIQEKIGSLSPDDDSNINTVSTAQSSFEGGGPQVIGIAGGIASGKTTFARILVERGYELIELSDLIRERLAEIGVSNPARSDFFTIANAGRRENGNDYWARQAVEHNSLLTSDSHRVISGIRTPEEVNYLRSRFANFLLVAVDAPQDVRIGRVRSRMRDIDPHVVAHILADMERELSDDLPEGCQLRATISEADAVIDSGGSVEQLILETDRFISSFAKII